MVKKILLFKQIGVCNNSLNYFNDCVIKELEKKKIEWSIVDITGTWESIEKDIREKIDENFDAAIAFNSGGQHNILDKNGENIFDKYGVPFYDWIVDTPIDLASSWKSSCRNFYILCMDRKHLNYIKKNFDHVKNAFFLPLGASEIDKPLKSLQSRQYDLVFCGGLRSLKSMLEDINGLPEEQKILVYDLINYSIENPEADINDVMETVLKDLLGTSDLGEENIEFVRYSARAANGFMRMYFRTEVIKALVNAKINLHLFGVEREF